MRQFCLRTLLFALPLLGLLALFEARLRAIPNDYSYKHSFWTSRPDDIEVLVLGSSHSYYGVDPAYFTAKGFNASHISQSIDLDHALFAEYVNGLHNLKTVIIPISYNTMFGKLMNSKERWRIKNYVIYYNLPLSWAPSDHFELMNGTVQASLDRMTAYLRHERTDLSCTELGASGTDPKSDDLMVTGEIAAKRHTRADRSRLPENTDHLKAIIALARSRNARIILFTPPAHRTYREHMDPGQWREAQAAVNDVLAGEDIAYFDLLASPAFVDEDFRDADHLSAAGRRKLSLMLDSLIKPNQ
jgi:hypothetical protein